MAVILTFDRLGRGLDMSDLNLSAWLLDNQQIGPSKVLGGTSVGYALDNAPSRSVFFTGNDAFSPTSGYATAARTYIQAVNDVFDSPYVEATVRVTGLSLPFNTAAPNQPIATSISEGDDTVTGNVFNDILRGGAGNDMLFGRSGGDILMGDDGNDTIDGGYHNNIVIGGAGEDTAILHESIEYSSVMTVGDWTLVIGRDAINALKGVEIVHFNVGFGPISLATLINSAPSFLPDLRPSFATTDLSTDLATARVPVAYDGPVDYLVLSFLGGATGEAVQGTVFADFINALGGDDAVNAGAGADVIDGGTGSNFITGGADRDVFFLDGRAGTSTWSTITDWQSSEQLSLWGWQKGISNVTWVDRAGAAGYEGVTLHADLDRDGLVETSVTWSGMTRADLPVGIEFDGLLWFK